MPEPILIARGSHDVHILPKMANRQRLSGVRGASRTVTLQAIAGR